MRGTITSCNLESLSDITALIICSSSASRTPCWLPCSTMRRISAAESSGVRVGSMPNGFEMSLVSATSTATSGLTIFAKRVIGPETVSAMRSGLARANPFGISSPSTIETTETIKVTKRSAIVSAWSAMSAMPRSGSATTVTMLTAATAEARAPRKVIATWITARKRPGSRMSTWARLARRSPASASSSRRVRRTETNAISAPTKNPLMRIKRRMIRMSVPSMAMPPG